MPDTLSARDLALRGADDAQMAPWAAGDGDPRWGESSGEGTELSEKP